MIGSGKRVSRGASGFGILVLGLLFGYSADASEGMDRTAVSPPLIPPAPAGAPVVVGAAALVQAQNSARPGDSSFIYRIGPEDELSVEVRGEETISRTVPVRPDGRITLPLIGDVPAVDRTVEELQATIAKALEPYLTTPQVQVSVVNATSAFPDRIRIIGKAVAPRSLPYREGMTALDAMIEIGGLPNEAAADSAYILRGSGAAQRKIRLRLGELMERGRMGANRPLRPGDILVIPEGFFSGDWEFEGSVGIAETYTDNITLTPTPFRDSALISELIPSFRVEADANRLQGAIDATVRLQYISKSDIEDFELAPDIVSTFDVELAENLFFTEFDASITRSLIDTSRGQSASQSNIQNQRITQTYRVSPYLTGRLGGFARLEARYEGELVLIEREETDRTPALGFGAGDSFENAARLRIEGMPQASRFSWTLSGLWSHTDLENRESRRRREALLHTELALSPTFALIAEGGWENFEGDDFSRDIDDPIGLGGFRWTPSPATELEALGGFDDGDDLFRAEFRHDFGETLTLAVSYDERADIDQGRLTGNLPRRIEDLDNFDPTPTDLTLRGDPTRTETLGGSLRGQIGATSLTLRAQYQTRELGVLGGTNDEELVSVEVGLTQPITRDIIFSAGGQYRERSFKEIEDVRQASEDDEYFANAGLSYTGFRRLELSLRYSFAKENSTRAFQDFTENAVTFTVTTNF